MGKKLISVMTDKGLFALVYISLLLLRSVYFLQKYADVFCKLCLVWGIFIIIYDLFKSRLRSLRPHKSWMPLILCVAFGASIIVNIEYSFYGGVKNMLYLVIYLFVLFAAGYSITREKFYLRLKQIGDVFNVITFVIALVSLVTFLFDIKFIYEVDGSVYKVGFWYNRLNGVLNSNMMTIYSLLALSFMVINYAIGKQRIGKKLYFYGINAVVQFVYYSLSGSRAVGICFAAWLFVLIAFAVYPKIRENKRFGVSIISSAVIFILVLSCSYGLKAGSQTVMKSSHNFIYKLFNSDVSVSEEDISFDRLEDFESEDVDITNNRSDMWRAAIKVIKQKPLFGTAYTTILDRDGNFIGGIDTSVFDENDITALKAADFYFHNGYIQILLCGGIIFTLCFLVFIFNVIFKYLKHLFTARKLTCSYNIFIVIAAMLAVIAIDNMVEVHLLFGGQDAIAAVFWYVLGSGLYLINTDNKEESLTENGAGND